MPGDEPADRSVERPGVLVVANPISGAGRASRRAAELVAELERLGIPVRLAFTDGPGDADRFVSSLPRDVGRVVSVGGDGTLRDVIGGLRDPSVAVGMLPTGTANILAKELHLPRRARDCARIVADGATVPFDLPAAGDRRFLAVAGVGFDAAATRAVNAGRTGAIRMWHYVAPLARLLCTYAHPHLRVTLHDGTGVVQVHEDLLSVVISNVRCYGGPFELASYAHHASGHLDVLMIRGRNAPASLATVMLAGFCRVAPLAPGVTYRQATSVTVESERPTPVQLDGDYTGDTPVRFTMGTERLRVLAPV